MIDGIAPPVQHFALRRAADGTGRAKTQSRARTGTASGSAAGTRSVPLGNTANYSANVISDDREQLKKAKFELRIWAQKAAIFGVDDPRKAHRVALCGWATAGGASNVGVRVSGGKAGFAGLQSCGSVWACPVCAAKVSARRASELGDVLAWARTAGHTLAMVTLTVSHKRRDDLKHVWDAVASGWEKITSGDAWNGEETDEEFAVRLGTWTEEGLAHDKAKSPAVFGPRLPTPRAPRGWHKGIAPKIRVKSEETEEEFAVRLGTWAAEGKAHDLAQQGPTVPRAPRGWNQGIAPKIRRGDKAEFDVLGWARSVEVTRGKNGWHVHIHAAMVLEGKEKAHERAFLLGNSMGTRWNAGIAKKGFTSSKRRGLKVDVWEGTEKTLAEYMAKSSDADAAVKQSMEKAGRDLAREATLGQHKKAHFGGRTPFQLLADLKYGVDEDWAGWLEWLRDSKGRQQLTWSADLRELAGLLSKKTDEEIAAEEVGTVDDTVLVLPLESWRQVRSDSAAMAKILILAETCVPDLRQWLDDKSLEWDHFVPLTKHPKEPAKKYRPKQRKTPAISV